MLPINITELLGHNQDYKRAKYLRGRSLRSRKYKTEDWVILFYCNNNSISINNAI